MRYLKKTISVVLACALLISSMCLTAFAAEESFAFSVSKFQKYSEAEHAILDDEITTAYPGDIVAVTFAVTNNSDANLKAGAYTAYLNYDANVFEPYEMDLTDEDWEGDFYDVGYLGYTALGLTCGTTVPGEAVLTGANATGEAIKKAATVDLGVVLFKVLANAEKVNTVFSFDTTQENQLANTNSQQQTVDASATATIFVDGATPVIDSASLNLEVEDGAYVPVNVVGGDAGVKTVQATALSTKGTDITSSVVWTVTAPAGAGSDADKTVTVDESGKISVPAKAYAGEYTVTASAKGEGEDAVSAGDPVSTTFTVTRAASVVVDWYVEQTYSAEDISVQVAPWTYHVIPALKADGSVDERTTSLNVYLIDQYDYERQANADEVSWTGLGDGMTGLSLQEVSYANDTTSWQLVYTSEAVSQDLGLRADLVESVLDGSPEGVKTSENVSVKLQRYASEFTFVTVEDIPATIPVSGSTTKQFAAVTKDQYGVDVEATKTWSIESATGLSINAETGEVTITKDAVAGEYDVTVSAVANGVTKEATATLTLSAINADWSGVIAVTGKEYGVTNEELVTLPATGELDYTLEAGSSDYDKTLTGVYSVVDGTAVPNAGTFDVEVSFKVDNDPANGEFAGVELIIPVEVTVAPKALTAADFTVENTTKTYDGSRSAAQVEVTPNVAGLFVTGSDAAYNSENVDDAESITVSNIVLSSDNYTAAGVTKTVDGVITAKTVTVSVADIAAVTYTGQQHTPAVTVTADDTVGGYALVKDTDYTVTYGENINAGDGTVTVTAKSGSNYTFTTVENKTFTINPKEAAVEWSDLTTTYNGERQEPTVSATGVAGETLTITVGGATTAGSHELTANLADVTGGQAKVANYTLTNTTNTFVIAQKELNASVGSVADKIYNGDTTATGTIALDAVVTGDDVTATGTFAWISANALTNKVNVTGITLSGEDAGNYILRADSISGAPAGNSIAKATHDKEVKLELNLYYGSTSTQTLTVDSFSNLPTVGFTGAELIEFPVSATGEAAAAIADLDFDSFKLNNEAAAGLIGKSATWTVSIHSSNYNPIEATVIVNIINKTPIDVSLDDAEIEYGETYTPAPTGGNAGGVWTYLYTGTTYGGEAYSSDVAAPTAAGEYTVKVNYEDNVENNGGVPGYIGEDTAVLIISKKSVDAVWANTALDYTGAEQAPTATASGINGATLTLNVTGGKTDAGTYTATAALSETDAANYTLGSNVTAEYTIAKVVLTPSVTSVDSKDYDGETDATGTIKLTGAVNGETPVADATFTWTSANAGTTTVDVAVALTDDAVNKNYVLSTESLPGVTAPAGAKINKLGVTVAWDKEDSYTYTGSVQTLPTASFTGVDGTVNCTVTVDGGKEFKNAGAYSFTAAEASGNYELANAALTGVEIAKADRTLSFAKTSFQLTPNAKTVTLVPSFNSADGSGSMVYGTSEFVTVSNTSNVATAVKNGTGTVTAQVAESANYNASNTVTLTFAVMAEYEVEVEEETEEVITFAPGVPTISEVTAAQTQIIGLEDAVSGAEAAAKQLAAANTGKIHAEISGEYTLSVEFSVEFKVTAANLTADPAKLTLEIQPYYTVYAVSADGTTKVEVKKVEVNTVDEAVTVSVNLPADFEPTVAKHTKDNGTIEWLDVTQAGQLATWKQDSFSKVELIEDKREVTVTFDDDETVTYDVHDIGVALPEGSQSGYTFNGWEFEGIDGTFTELTEELWNALAAAGSTATAEGSYTQNERPSGKRYDVNVSAGRNGDVTVSSTSAIAGTKITVTVEPDAGYKVGEITVTDKLGREVKLTAKGSTYTFYMPASDVVVRVSFTKGGVNPFTDVPESKYYYDAVLWAVENGITNGATATTFNPNGACTRAQVVTFLWRAAGSPAPESYENPFTDVASDKYYYEAVLWAVENGITKGATETTFNPNGIVSRAQVVTFLFRSVSGAKAEGENPFTDVATDKYYYEAVLWAVENGITNGATDTTFNPDGACTRGQIVTFLYRHFA